MAIDPGTAYVATAGVNAATGLLDGYLNRRYNERQVDKQWSRMLDQWHRENAYNHPSAQVARMKEAGLNPALMYANGGGFVPAASSPSPDRSESGNFGVKQNLDPMAAANIELMQAQAENLRAQTKTEDDTRDFKVGEYVAKISKMSSEEQLNFATIARYTIQNEVDQKLAESQSNLWNQMAAKEQALAHMTWEQYDQLVAFRALKALNLKLTNDELLARIGVEKAQKDHFLKLAEEVRQRTEFEYSDEMREFKAEFIQAQTEFQEAQAEYWDDYVANPAKFMSFTEGYHISGPFGIGYGGTTQSNYENANGHGYSGAQIARSIQREKRRKRREERAKKRN